MNYTGCGGRRIFLGASIAAGVWVLGQVALGQTMPVDAPAPTAGEVKAAAGPAPFPLEGPVSYTHLDVYKRQS